MISRQYPGGTDREEIYALRRAVRLGVRTPSGGSDSFTLVESTWTYRKQPPPPAVGEIREDGGVLYISETDSKGVDRSPEMDASSVPLEVLLRGPSGAYQHWAIDGATDLGDYRALTGSVIASSGTVSNGAEVTVTWRAGAAGGGGGGGGTPHIVDTVEPNLPVDGTLWTNPDEDVPWQTHDHDADYLSLAGGTMTGVLTASGAIDATGTSLGLRLGGADMMILDRNTSTWSIHPSSGSRDLGTPSFPWYRGWFDEGVYVNGERLLTTDAADARYLQSAPTSYTNLDVTNRLHVMTRLNFPATGGRSTYVEEDDEGYLFFRHGGAPAAAGIRINNYSTTTITLSRFGTITAASLYLTSPLSTTNNTLPGWRHNTSAASDGWEFMILSSSARYKSAIEDHDGAVDLDRINALRLRSWRSEADGDDKRRRFTGVVAEEAVEVMPELVGHNEDGEVESFSYDGLIVPLVGAVQALTKRVAKLEAT